MSRFVKSPPQNFEIDSRDWQRLVIKIGTSSLTDEQGGISTSKMEDIAAGMKDLAEILGCKCVLVSSGAGAAGRQRLGLRLPLTLPEKQAAAAVGQTLLMLQWSQVLAPQPVAQVLLTASDIQNRESYVNAKNALEASLKLGTLPIINENDSVATDEIKLGDNDTLSAWTSYLVGANALIILTDVDGLYEADPSSNQQAKRIDVVEDIRQVEQFAGKAGSSRGTGGMQTKLRAAKIATEAGIETFIIGGGGQGLKALAKGEVRGTRFIPKGHHTPARKAWLAQQAPRGRITIDEGALKALQAGRSLLAKGITKVEGHFNFGDTVAIVFSDEVAAQGLTNYDSKSLTRIKGQHSQDIFAILGYKDYDEAIHRDNLMVLRS